MTREIAMGEQGRSFTLRVLLFAFGLLVLIAALLLLRGYEDVATDVFLFTSIDAIVLYGVLFGPILAVEQLRFLTGGRIVSAVMALKATLPYAVLSVALMFLANMPGHPPNPLLWVAQLALLFGLCLALHFSALTSAHIESVEKGERRRRASVDDLRSSATQLALAASCLDETDDAARGLADLTERISEELRFLSPSADPKALALEDRIASHVASLADQVEGGRLSPAQARDATQVSRETLALIRQRKALLD